MRTDFTNKTKEILAKRVGYRCSKPDCGQPTVGPGVKDEEVISIGVAAHITAASPGGPRYDVNMSEAQRAHVSNGIWLCQTHSRLIDVDSKRYSIGLLQEWKESAEETNLLKLVGGRSNENGKFPFLEVDLIWSHGGRTNLGWSAYNKEIYERPIPAGTDLYAHWRLSWNFSLVIHNNSEVTAYNASVMQTADITFGQLEELPKVNHLLPFESIIIEARYEKYIHGMSKEADEILEPMVPLVLSGLELELSYLDDRRELHRTLFTINNSVIRNSVIN